MPPIDAMPDDAALAAASMASARALTTFRPSSKDMAPPKTRAEYSPSEKPAAVFTFLSISGASVFAISIAASEHTKMAGCE